MTEVLNRIKYIYTHTHTYVYENEWLHKATPSLLLNPTRINVNRQNQLTLRAPPANPPAQASQHVMLNPSLGSFSSIISL